MSQRLFPLSILLAFSTAITVRAHNGHLTTAEPVNKITIDGKLDDWPEKMKSHPIAAVLSVHNHGTSEQPQVSEASFEGRYRVGFNAEEDAIYVAVESKDDNVTLEPQGGDDWNAQDSCELFFVLNHSDAKSSPVQFAYRERPYAIFNGSKNEKLLKAVRVARASDDSSLIYEWRIDLKQLRSDDQEDSRLEQGTVIGFDVAYNDRDDEGYAFYCSSEGTYKYMNASELGDLLISPKNVKFAQVAGKSGWRSSHESRPRAVQFTSQENASLSITLPVGKNGQFMGSLPQGDYVVVAISQAGTPSSDTHDVALWKDHIVPERMLFDFGDESEEAEAESAVHLEVDGKKITLFGN